VYGGVGHGPRNKLCYLSHNSIRLWQHEIVASSYSYVATDSSIDRRRLSLSSGSNVEERGLLTSKEGFLSEVHYLCTFMKLKENKLFNSVLCVFSSITIRTYTVELPEKP